MALIVDTGVALDILAQHPGGELRDTMLSWIKHAVTRIEPPCPRGRRVSMFVSSGIYRDYKARMSKKIDASHSSWHALRKSLFTRPIDRQNRLTFTMQSVSTDRIDTGDWDGDRLDRPFFALLEAVRQHRAWAGYRTILASKDRDASARVRDLVFLRDSDGRVHLADSLLACEELVVCQGGA